MRFFFPIRNAIEEPVVAIDEQPVVEQAVEEAQVATPEQESEEHVPVTSQGECLIPSFFQF